jgi:hypothetical protein
MEPYTPLELELMEKMTPQHKELMSKLTDKERKYMTQNVTVDNIGNIQSWMGTDQDIEKMLFWDRGGKFDDPEWQALKPVDQTTAILYEKAAKRFKELKVMAVESQRRSDLTLFSQFNEGLVFTSLSGAVRCDVKGVPAEKGGYFKGIEWKCIGSVEEQVNSITIYPADSGEFEVHLGSRVNDKPQGIWVYTGDSHSLLQLAQVAIKILPGLEYEVAVKDKKGKELILDPKEIRKAAMDEKGGDLGYGDELNLFASRTVNDPDSAIEASESAYKRFYERFGLETEAHKIGKIYGNFFIMREENFDSFLPTTPIADKGLILLTATLVCRRCRREMEEFRDLAKHYPHVKAVLVNLSSPQFKFYDRVFADMGGGDPDEFRKNAAGVTPFIIVYTADENGVLKYMEYISTGKAENPPSLRKNMPHLDQYLI